MSVQTLPAEILLMVMSHLESVVDRNAIARANRRCYRILNRELYILSISNLFFFGIFWAAREGQLQTLQKFLHATPYGLSMVPKSPYIDWRPIWEVWPSWGAKVKGDQWRCIPVFTYKRGYGRYGSSHIPIICLYRDALVDAAKSGNVEAVKLLAEKLPWRLDEIEYYEHRDDEGWWSLSHLAARYNQPRIMELLLANDTNAISGFPPSVQETTSSPLHIACREGHVEILKLLLDHGVDPDMPDSNVVTPLVLAISRGHQEVVQTLLCYGANCHQKFRQLSLLNLVPVFGRVCVLPALLDSGLSPDGLDSHGKRPAIIEGPITGFSTGDIWHTDPKVPRGYSAPLSMAALLKRADCAQMLLDYGANPNIVEPNGEIPLHIALEHGDLETASILVQYGARVDMTDSRGNCALHYALLPDWRNLELLNLLLENGYPKLTHEWMFRVLEYGHSPVGVSLPPSIVNHREAISGPSIRCYDCDSRRPCDVMHYDDCSYRRFYEPDPPICSCAKLVEVFLNHGIPIDAPDSLGRTLLHHAAYWMCKDTIELIHSRGGNLQAHDMFFQTPLHLSMVHQPINPSRLCEIWRFLLSEGANPNSKDDNGQTPLHIAAQAGNFSAIGVMIEWALKSGGMSYKDKETATTVSQYLDVAALDNSGNTPFHLGAMSLTRRSDPTGILLWLNTIGGTCRCTTEYGQSRCETLRRGFHANRWFEVSDS